ncbi:MAG TPA: cell division protein ZapA [Caulobacteraceae bacterium]|nr:cell division protein ZapA [Caulobacteraceae bacterium]
MAQVTIEVNGHPYVVGCEDGQERRLTELAATVDAQVRQVAMDVGPLGETRLILMGALVMADDIVELRRELEQLEAQLAELAAERGRAEHAAVAALEAAAARIEALATE